MSRYTALDAANDQIIREIAARDRWHAKWEAAKWHDFWAQIGIAALLFQLDRQFGLLIVHENVSGARAEVAGFLEALREDLAFIRGRRGRPQWGHPRV